MIKVWTDAAEAGLLDRHGERGSTFAYLPGTPAARAASLTMPVRLESWSVPFGLPPIFEMNLPEGVLRERLRLAFAKATGTFDEFDLLSIVGRSQVGRIRYTGDKEQLHEDVPFQSVDEILERRRGGETGIKSVQLIEGPTVWEAGEQGRYSKRLLEAALSRSDKILGKTTEDARPQDLVGSGLLPKIVPQPAAYFIERRDGTRTTLLMLNGAVADYTFACRLKGSNDILSTQFFLTPTPNVTYSASLGSKIEEMFTTGLAPYPVERTQIVCGILESCLDSKVAGHSRLETPHLDVTYRAPAQSQFCRA